MKEKVEKVMEVLRTIKPHTYVSIIMMVISVINYGLMAAVNNIPARFHFFGLDFGNVKTACKKYVI